MNLLELKSLFIEELIKIYSKEETLSFYYILIEDYLKLDKSKVFLEPNRELSHTHLNQFKTSLKLLKQEKPIQYILGKTTFYNLTFEVNEHVLIPRPETEELVQWILKDIEKGQTTSTIQLLDIGTGSGCIAISLAKLNAYLKVSALDISKKALTMAKKNAKSNEVKINFITQDILKTPAKQDSKVLKKYDIIVSNPPYVRELEKTEMQNNVLQNEPHLALFVDNENPLLFYNKIADFAKESLTEKGLLYFEINQYLSNETVQLLEQKGFEMIEIRKDFFGNKRMLKATNKSNL